MTTQHAEQHDLNPLILPLFGIPESLKMNVWYWKNSAPRDIKSISVNLDLYYGYDEVDRTTRNRGDKTIVFGSWQYRNTIPTSTLTFGDGEDPSYSKKIADHTFSIGAVSIKETFLKLLLRQFDKKMISIWWDSTTPLWSESSQQNSIAELAIGGVNPSRFIPLTEVRFKVITRSQPASMLNAYFLSSNAAYFSVGNSAIIWSNPIAFDITQESILSMVIYDAITKPLRDEMRYTVGLLKGYGRNINGGIMQYHDFNEPILEFDCQYGDRLLPLHIDQLTITPRMMYKKISNNKCKMSLRRSEISEISEQQELIILGIDVIRHFYVSISYNTRLGDTFSLYSRVEGEAPEVTVPPAGTPCESSHAHASESQTFSSYCIIS